MSRPSNRKPPISALFLAKFDVSTGYTLEWSKVIDESISLKGLEFKSLPSGLHQSSKDVIAFTEDLDETQFPKRLVYGVSVFRSNLDENIEDRADVRMYSLGLLIDPKEYTANARTAMLSSTVWKPLLFTSGWEYIPDLEALLKKWLDVTEEGLEKYKILENFFKERKHGDGTKADIGSNLEVPKTGSSADTDETPIELSSSSSAVMLTHTAKVHQNQHMLLSLTSLLENFGPLIFKIWKLSLLRSKIMVHNAETIELNCSFNYCISLISTIPQEILPSLITTGISNFEALQFHQPLYNVGVNDINYLESIIKNSNTGFIASTTDEILLYKPYLYDYSVKLPSEDTLPEVIASSDYQRGSPLLKATQRDLRRFKILFDEFDLYADNYCAEDDWKWWLHVSEPTSWKEFVWKGFSWWATAGENDRSNHDSEIDKEGLDNISTFTDAESIYTSTNNNAVLSSKPSEALTVPTTNSATTAATTQNEISKEVTDVLKLVGYFQNMTIKIFEVLIDVINNHESDDTDQAANDGASDDEEEDANSGNKKTEAIYISLNDINEMGLDPYSAQDSEFVVQLVKVWWGKEAKVGTYLGNICC